MNRIQSLTDKQTDRIHTSLTYYLPLPKIRNLSKKIKAFQRKMLKNKDFSLVSSNCNGTFMLHDLHLQFRSPFVNLWIKPKDFIKLLSALSTYMAENLTFIKEEGIDYPVGCLRDIKIYFQHYKTEEEALTKWNERKNRINYDNLYVLFSDRDGCTYDDLKAFDELLIKHKVVFTHKHYPEIKSSMYIRGFENEKSVGFCHEFIPHKPYMRYLDQFDYVRWFNNR